MNQFFNNSWTPPISFKYIIHWIHQSTINNYEFTECQLIITFIHVWLEIIQELLLCRCVRAFYGSHYVYIYVRYTLGPLYVQTTPTKNDEMLTIWLIVFPEDMVCGSLPRHWRTRLTKGSLMPQRMSFWRFVTSQLLEITATLFLCSVWLM